MNAESLKISRRPALFHLFQRQARRITQLITRMLDSSVAVLTNSTDISLNMTEFLSVMMSRQLMVNVLVEWR
jgi:hypothetical protein